MLPYGNGLLTQGCFLWDLISVEAKSRAKTGWRAQRLVFRDSEPADI